MADIDPLALHCGFALTIREPGRRTVTVTGPLSESTAAAITAALADALDELQQRRSTILQPVSPVETTPEVPK